MPNRTEQLADHQFWGLADLSPLLEAPAAYDSIRIQNSCAIVKAFRVHSSSQLKVPDAPFHCIEDQTVQNLYMQDCSTIMAVFSFKISLSKFHYSPITSNLLSRA